MTPVDPPEIGEKFLIDGGEERENCAELPRRIVSNRGEGETVGSYASVIDISNMAMP